MLVLAGPGSGKTSVLISHIQQLITNHHAEPQKLLVVTFTRAAAAEMRERYLKNSRLSSTEVTFGTLHGVFYAILRGTKKTSHKRLVAGEEKRRLLDSLLEDLGQAKEQRQEQAELLAQEIGQIKHGGLKPEEYQPESLDKEEFLLAWRSYQEALSQMEAMDFEDLALEVARLFAQEEGVRKSWQERFTYVLVDEFQDIDRGQYELLKILAAPQNNLFMVGDDDQSIYGFRGAAPEVMRQVTEDFPALQQVVLDINYRCGSRIIDCAGQLIAHNTGRFEKKAISGRGHTGEVCTWTAEDKREEWLLLAQDIRKEIEKGRKPAEIAVLTRTNRSAAGILKTLWSQGISCSWGSGKKEGTEGEKKGQSLAEHFIWKDMEAYLLLGENRRERGLYLRILNKPRRYLSREVFREAVVNREGCLAAAGEDRIGRSRLERFFQELALLQGLPPAAALYCIRRRMGYDTYLEGVAQLQHREPEELLAVMDILQKLSLGKKDLKEFKGAVKAYTWPVSEEGVRVTTLHGSKGLEYDVVYIPDVNKGNIPWNGAKSQAEVEEERRLFYVGMTRAREKLCLLWVDGEEGSRGQPSPFLEEAGVGAPSLKSIPEKERI